MASHKYLGGISPNCHCGLVVALLTDTFQELPSCDTFMAYSFACNIEKGVLGSYYNVTNEAGVFPPMSNVYIFNPGRISLFCYENAKHYRALVAINCNTSAEIWMLQTAVFVHCTSEVHTFFLKLLLFTIILWDPVWCIIPGWPGTCYAVVGDCPRPVSLTISRQLFFGNSMSIECTLITHTLSHSQWGPCPSWQVLLLAPCLFLSPNDSD